MQIFVPTRGRVNRQTTLERWFLRDLPYPITFVVPESERRKIESFNVETVPDEYKLSDVLQHIVTKLAEDHMLWLDDDLFCFRRTYRDDGSIYLGNASLDDVRELMAWIKGKFDEGYVHGGVSLRPMNHTHPPEEENHRVCSAHMIRADVLRAEEFDFRDLVTKQDFHMTLTLLERGYPNIVTFEWAQGQSTARKNKQGGVDWYRTADEMSCSSYRLAELHAPFVTPRVKNIVHGSMGYNTTVTDVTVQWKKAYCSKAHERKL